MRASLIALAAAASLVAAQTPAFSSLAACGQNCINNVRISTGCVPVTDQCLCGKPSFENGIHDCVTAACPAADAQAAVAYTNSFCAAANPPASSAAPKTTETQSPSPTTSPSQSSTPKPESTSTTPKPETSSTSSKTSASVATTSSSSSSSSTTSSTSSTLSTSSHSATPSTTSSSSSTSVPVASSTSTPTSAPDTNSSNTGLSTAAKAGIGIGIGAAALAALTVALCCCLRRRRNGSGRGSVGSGGKPSKAGMIKISDPLPGTAGRTYAGDRHNAKYMSTRMSARKSKGDMNELDQYSRRYEDMLPRRDPAPMV